MNIKDYPALSNRTEKMGDHFFRLRHAGMGMVTEAGELVDQIKRHRIYDKELDFVNVKEELGDFCWYVSIGADELKVPFEELLDFATEVHLHDIVRFGEDSLLLLEYGAYKLAQYAQDFYGGALDAWITANRVNRKNEMKRTLSFALKMVRFIADRFGWTLEDVLEANVAKLMKRYPNGFTPEAALNRDSEGERQTLELSGQEPVTPVEMAVGGDEKPVDSGQEIERKLDALIGDMSPESQARTDARVEAFVKGEASPGVADQAPAADSAGEGQTGAAPDAGTGEPKDAA